MEVPDSKDNFNKINRNFLRNFIKKKDQKNLRKDCKNPTKRKLEILLWLTLEGVKRLRHLDYKQLSVSIE